MKVKPLLFRDPVHDTIALEVNGLPEQLVIALIDTKEMQRLRHISQLGLTKLVYPGAEHSRFQHSLGVMWTAHQMLNGLEKHHKISTHERILVLAGALLHDVGHGPMSHALETTTQIPHERWTEAIIIGKNLDGSPAPSEISQLLEAFETAHPEHHGLKEDLLSLYHKGPLPAHVPPFVRDMVSSQLDADRLDYILRDGHHTGVKIGGYDLARILALLGIMDQKLVIHRGALEAVEGYLLARFHMYKQVYLHKTCRSAEKMMSQALKRAKVLAQSGDAPAYLPSGPLGLLIQGESLATPEFTSLDDHDIWMAMKAWTQEKDLSLRSLADGLVRRQLYKTIALPSNKERAHEWVEAARGIARVNGFNPDDTILVDESQDSLYEPYTGIRKDEGDEDSIRIALSYDPPRMTFIEEESKVLRMLQTLELSQHFLIVHPALKEAISRLK